MSFKSKLILFFLVIVILPMAASAFLIVKSAGEINQTKNEAILADALNVASQVYKKDQREAYQRIKRISEKKSFQNVLNEGNTKKINRYLKREFKKDSFGGVTGYFKNNQVAFKIGNQDGLSLVRLKNQGGIKAIDFSLINPDILLRKVEFLTEKPFLLKSNKKTIAATIKKPGDFSKDYIEINVLDADGKRKTLKLFAFTEKNPTSQITNQPLLLAVFVALLILAIVVAILLQKSIRAQIAEIAKKTRKISDGQFDVTIKASGSDELSALSSEINKMSQQIKKQIEALEDQSGQLEKTINFLNKIMSATLNSKKLLKTVVDSILEISKSEFVQIKYLNQEDSLKEKSSTDKKYLLELAGQAKEGQQKIKDFYLLKIIIDNEKNEELAVTLARKNLYNDQDIEMVKSIARSAFLSLNNIYLHKKITKEALTDSLTGLSTRRRFDEAYRREFLRAKRFQSPLSLIMIDVDYFKKLNDRFGHLVGDQYLKDLGLIIKDNCREVDEPARFGGEEFVILLPETETGGAEKVAERIRKEVEDKLKTTISLGLSQINKNDEKEDLLKRADQALYLAKENGRNQIAKS